MKIALAALALADSASLGGGPAPTWEPDPGPQANAAASQADIIGYGGAAGGGKALSLDTSIPTPDGWTTMGEIRAGDTLFDDNGLPCRVVATSDIMLDHDIYDVCFDDGSVIRADSDHRWATLTDSERSAGHKRTDEYRANRRAKRASRSTGKRPDLAERNRLATPVKLDRPQWGIRTTLEILQTLRVGRAGRVNHSVAVAKPLELPERPLVIPPYALGVWLGDGNARRGTIYVHAEDIETVEFVSRLGFQVKPVPSEPIGWSVRGLMPLLRSCGLLANKHVPPDYLRASLSQRLELLRGLMDTDGDCDPDGSATFTTTLPGIADQVLELAHTLGIKATKQEGRATLYGKDCGPKYRIKMTTSLIVFRLKRKADRQNRERRPTQSMRYIVNVDRVASVPVKCVAVDSPSRLYLAGPTMIPTHNTDLLVGLASTQHTKSIIFRREYPQLKDIVRRAKELTEDTRVAFNGNDNLLTLSGGKTIEFGAMQNPNDWERYKGRPHDLKAYDEATEFLETQVRSSAAWLRTTVEGQRTRIILTFNPPTNVQGMWVIRFFAPWLDPNHSNPAKPGELRWYATVDGKHDVECASGEPFDHHGEMIYPTSRTFFPARLADNPRLMKTGYGRTLNALPEPLRSQLLYGDFAASMSPDPWQVIPTAWVDAAMRRHAERLTPGGRLACDEALRPYAERLLSAKQGRITCIGLDVAHGGKDKTVLANRRSDWIDPLIKVDGRDTPDGLSAAKLVMQVWEEGCYVNVDVIGYGASAHERLQDSPPAGYGIPAIPVNFACRSEHYDKSGKYRMVNVRAEAYWRLREELDPDNGATLCLPPDTELRNELCEARYEITTVGIKIESKDDIKERLTHSPDCADAVALTTLPNGQPFAVAVASPRVEILPQPAKAQTAPQRPAQGIPGAIGGW